MASGNWRIVDWMTFEAAHGRRPVEGMTWVRVATSQGGKRFRRLMERRGGVEAFGVFILLVEVVAKLPQEHRTGALIDERGEPVTLDDLRLATGASTTILARGIKALCEDDIAWLENTALHAATCNDMQQHAGACATVQEEKEKRREEEREKNPPRGGSVFPDSLIEPIWEAYPEPRRVARTQTFKAIREALAKIQTGTEAFTPYAAAVWLLARVEGFAQTPKGRGQYCWNASNFFTDGHYDDDAKGWQDRATGGEKMDPRVARMFAEDDARDNGGPSE